MYESNPQNANFYYLTFDVDERFINRRRIYHAKDDIVESFNNDLIVEVYIHWM